MLSFKDGLLFKISMLMMSILLAPVGAFAKDCISQPEMAEIAQHFSQFQNISRGEYCYDGSQTSNLLMSLMFMRKTAFAPAMTKSPDELFSGRFSQDWFGYFIGRINDINVQSDCPKGVGAYVYGFGNTMYVCPMLLSDNFTAMDRASVFMHEARHIDGYPHVTCRRGARAGLQGACDSRISDGGSYAVTVETYAQLAEYAPNLHPALRMYARASAITYADEAFEAPVQIDRSNKFLIMTGAKELQVIDPNNSFQTSYIGNSPALGQIVMRGQNMILFPEDKNAQAKYVFTSDAGDIQQQAGDIAAEYNAQSPAQRGTLMDAHIGAQWTARIYNDRILFTCDPRGASTVTVSLNGEKAVRVLYPTGYDRAAKTIQLVSESGRIFDVNCTGTSTASVRASAITFDRPFRRVLKSGSITLGLSMDGRLYQIENGRSVPLNTPDDGNIVELVPYQSFSFFDIAKF